MGYEWISTVIILTLFVIMLVALLPRKTVSSMKRMVERHEDKYSMSLHLIDVEQRGYADDAPHDQQDKQPNKGGVLMSERLPQASAASASSAAASSSLAISQPQSTAHMSNVGVESFTAEHIAHVRALRRRGVRHRRTIVGVLGVSVVACGIAGIWLPLCWWLLPLVVLLLGVVLGFGIRAARHACAWERLVREQATAVSATSMHAASSTYASQQSASAHTSHAALPSLKSASLADAQPTLAMSSQAIQATAQREHRARLASQRTAEQSQVHRPPSAATSTQSPSATNASAQQQRRIDALSSAPTQYEAITTAAHEHAFRMSEHAMVAAATQDLISFTLGTPRGDEPMASAEPQSLEIKANARAIPAVPPTQPVNAANVTNVQSTPSAQSIAVDAALAARFKSASAPRQ